jgi:hypothetical protein
VVRLEVRRTAGVATFAALLASGCSAGNEVVSGMGIPSSESASTASGIQAIAQPPSETEPGLVVTSRQRGYLNALTGAHIRPSSELVALSIGSYVCQARAAHQSDQAVWDFVVPMVRADVRDNGRDDGIDSAAPPTGEVNSATADYIRIATDKLC